MGVIKDMLWKQKRSVRFYKYLFSYIALVLVLLFIIIGVIYGNFINVLQKEVEASNISAMARIRDTMDMRLKEMERIAVQIDSNPVLTPFMMSNNDGYSVFEAVHELNKYRASNAFIYDIVLYYNYRDTGKVYTSNGTYSLDTFFGYIYKYSGWNKDSFVDDIVGIRSPVMRPVENVKLSNAYKEGFATYIYPLPTNIARPYGAVIFMISEDAMKNMIQGVLKDYNGYVFILDQSYKPIMSAAGGQTLPDGYDILGSLNIDTMEAPVDTVTVNNRSFSVVKLSSNYNNWSYTVAMPTDQFMRKVYDTRKIFDYTTILMLTTGMILSFIFASQHYKPLQRLAEGLKKGNYDGKVRESVDELDLIYSSMAQRDKENQGLVAKLKTQDTLMKDQTLRMLLKGKFRSANEIEDMLTICDLKFAKPCFAVMLFIIDDYTNFKETNTEPMQDILKYSVANVLEELSLEIGCGYSIDMIDDHGVALVLNFDMTADVERYMSELAYKAKDFFKENFGFTMTVGIGDIYDDISAVPRSFKEANDTAYYQIVRGKDQIIFYKDIKDESKSGYWYPTEQEARLIAAIRRGDGNDTECIMKDIMRELSKYSLSNEIVQCVCFGIVNTIMKVLNQIGTIEYDAIDEQFEGLLTSHIENMSLLEEYMVHICRQACDYVGKYKESNSFDLCDEIAAYAQQHYSDSNISLESIAAEFGLSPSYITGLFRDRTGSTLMRYIDALRMDKARELLKNTDLLLRTIIECTGYVDEANFIRKFKKNEGVTPIQYRDQYRRKEYHKSTVNDH